MTPNKELDATLDVMMVDRKVRTAITRESHLMFFHFYFAHYVKYKTADFQKEIFALTEDEMIRNLYIVAFRGSGKSTMITTSYPIWAILGKQQKKFVVILCQTQIQAKQHMVNLKRELESNDLLKNDLGPFQEEKDEWGTTSLVFTNMNARITAASSEQSIRGLRHGQHRPDLIIGDDVENMASAKTKEGREKTYKWLKGEIVPLGDLNTKVVIVGNLLHENSLLMHLKRDAEENDAEGVFKEYPLLSEDGKILWEGKYPTMKEIERERKNLGDDISWKREFLLYIVPDEDQIFLREHIKTYTVLPQGRPQIIIGVDLAISQKASADYTAIVPLALYGNGESFRIYVLPNIIERKMDFDKTLTAIKGVYDGYGHLGRLRKIYCENNSYQEAAVQQLKNAGYKTEGIHVSIDKRSRLASISNLVISGKVLFPETGGQNLIQQLIGFGKERHDDLVDAFSMGVGQSINHNKRKARVFASNSAVRQNLRRQGL